MSKSKENRQLKIDSSIDDVAKLAGVSISTVSRVLNRKVPVSKELKNKVDQAIRELEYQPSQAARMLASKKSNTIGIIVPDLSYAYYSSMISSIEYEAGLHDYHIVVCSIQEDFQKEIKYINLFKNMYISGLILMHEKINKTSKTILDQCNFPIVQASVKIKNFNSLSINIDDYKASFTAVKYLINKGHKDIAMIGGDSRDHTSGYQRKRGYLDALSSSNIKANNNFYKVGDFSYKSGFSQAKELLSRKERPTAIFIVSDTMAAGALNAIRESGFKVPEDISLIGFDDIPLAQMVRPALSTINQPAALIGRLAVLSIIKKSNSFVIDGKEYFKKDNCIEVPFTLIERESVSKINC